MAMRGVRAGGARAAASTVRCEPCVPLVTCSCRGVDAPRLPSPMSPFAHECSLATCAMRRLVSAALLRPGAVYIHGSTAPACNCRGPRQSYAAACQRAPPLSLSRLQPLCFSLASSLPLSLASSLHRYTSPKADDACAVRQEVTAWATIWVAV